MIIRKNIKVLLFFLTFFILVANNTWAEKIELSYVVFSNGINVASNAIISNNGYVLGNLGIGTTNPATRLHVKGSAIIETNLTLRGTLDMGYQSIKEVGTIGYGATPTIKQGPVIDMTDYLDIYSRTGFPIRLHGGSTAATYVTVSNDYLLATGLFEGTTALSAKYLGLSAKVADADKLDGVDSSGFYRITGDTLEGTLTAGGNSGTNFSSLNSTSFNMQAASYTEGFRVVGRLGAIYHPRNTDPAVYDFGSATLTEDSAWHDLDLSGIVPVGTKAVQILIYCYDTSAGKSFEIRQKGVTNDIDRVPVFSIVSSAVVLQMGIVSVDSNRLCQYYVTSGMDAEGLIVQGWFE